MRVLFFAVVISIVLFSCSGVSDDNEVCEQATVAQVGESVAGFSLTSLDGNITNIDNLKGKTVFLNFFVF